MKTFRRTTTVRHVNRSNHNEWKYEIICKIFCLPFHDNYIGGNFIDRSRPSLYLSASKHHHQKDKMQNHKWSLNIRQHDTKVIPLKSFTHSSASTIRIFFNSIFHFAPFFCHQLHLTFLFEHILYHDSVLFSF